MAPIITSLYAGIATILIVLLSLNVSRHRMMAKVSLGDGNDQLLRVAIRMQGNAIEYLPLALLLMALIEIQSGIAGMWLHLLGILLLLGRVLHIYGLSKTAGTSAPRRNGIVITWLVLLVLALTNIAVYFGY